LIGVELHAGVRLAFSRTNRLRSSLVMRASALATWRFNRVISEANSVRAPHFEIDASVAVFCLIAGGRKRQRPLGGGRIPHLLVKDQKCRRFPLLPPPQRRCRGRW